MPLRKDATVGSNIRQAVLVCQSTGCISSKSPLIKAALEEEVAALRLAESVQIKPTGCQGLCEHGPNVTIEPEGILYTHVKVEDVLEIVRSHLRDGRPVERLFYRDAATGERIPYYRDIPFYRKQERLILRHCGHINPEEIDDYLAVGGYQALRKALFEMMPQQVVEDVKRSGLRGRGGAGFPTGRKWQYCRDAPGALKYVICNGDEGDPGAYMDRTILEANPHSVLEGMLIGAYAIGASEGYFYVRDEYPLAVERVRRAIAQAKERGFLGEDILGSGFDFQVAIVRGAGAFVCGEETALLASIEGQLGEPRPRPPFPATSGLWGKPTVINNVKTWASVPPIITHGADWYARMGTERSKGTVVFSLVGKVNNTGLVEVPLGITLREMIYGIGGGIPNGKAFKAVQTGGPSGGCIPASMLDLPIDYETLTKAGSIMGSGGMVVMDEDACMVDVARYFISFTMDESCGKCIPCREGIQEMHKILTDITAGRGKEGDLERLEELAYVVKDGSLCALGGTAPNPVLTTIRYFRDEYEAHIKYKRCPAVVCRGIVSSACQHVCPLDQDVPAYIGLIARGQFDEAMDVIRQKNPLPGVLGRICHHPCEAECPLGEGGQPIAIQALKRFVADYELRKGIKPIPPPEKVYAEKVAIIGSGPAGLTAAYFLAQRGYDVTIFEALPVAGGMLAVGLPEYRLPKDILNLEIEAIKRLGVTIKTNTPVGQDITLKDLRDQGYEAIFIAIGAHKGLKMGIPDEDVAGVLDAMSFLRDVNWGRQVELGNKVAVIGGGNVAIDAARVAKRLGCEVQVIYRRTRAEMPAFKEEIEGAIEEGVDIRFLAAPVRVLSSDARLKGIECTRMELGEFDETGRRRPIPIKGSEFTVDLDTLIYAIRQEPDLSFLLGDGIEVSAQNTIIVDPETFATNVEGIFAGGDTVSGPATVVEAMAAGKTAAESIHRYLRGESLQREHKVTRPAVYVEPVELSAEEVDQILELGRPAMPSLPVVKRRDNFKEVHLGFTAEMAVREAKRCVRCDLESLEEARE